MTDTIRIRNRRPAPRSIIYQGAQLTLDAHDEQLFAAEVAQVFLQRHPLDIEKVDDKFGEAVTPMKELERVYLANVTGDPDAPVEMEVKVYKDKQWQLCKVANPFKAAQPLCWIQEGPMVEYQAKDGAPEARNMPPTRVEIPAYKRAAFDPITARWIRTRVGRGTPLTSTPGIRKLIDSRPPSSFEPDMTWPLDDMRIYLRMADATCPTGDSEMDIRRAGEKRGLTNEEVETTINDAKRLVMKRLFFRLVDPEYALPTRGEFEQFKLGGLRKPEQSPMSEERVAKIVAQASRMPDVDAKKRGRPRSIPNQAELDAAGYKNQLEWRQAGKPNIIAP